MLGSSAAGMAGLGSLALVGCGNDDDNGNGAGNGSQTPSGTGSQPTTAPGGPSGQPVHGGTYRAYLPGDPVNLDPSVGTALTSQQTHPYVYSRLFRYEAGPGIDPHAYRPVPDLAESFEISEDGLEYTVKLREDVQWHPPVSRTMTAEDVEYTWLRFTGEVPGVQASPTAGVITRWLDTVEAVDEFTVLFKLKQPRGELFSSENRWLLIMPKEAGELFDPSQQMVGTGPWIFESYTPGTSMVFRRNPDWHLGPEAPYFDNVEVALISDYSARLTQFLAGNLDEVDVAGIDLGRVADSMPDAQVLVRGATLPGSYITFEGEFRAPDAPWRDPRVRQAVSMAIDRDGALEAAYNLSEVEALGYDLARVWNNDIPAQERPFWLDPQGSFQHDPSDLQMPAEMQEYFQYSPENARQMLEAAGYPDGFEVSLRYTSGRYGDAYNTMTELLHANLIDAGFHVNLVDEDYAAVFQPITAVTGEFEGMAHIPRGAGVRPNFENYYIPGGSRNNAKIDDPELTGMIEEMLANPDAEGARKQVLELQQHVNELMYLVPMQLGASGDYFAYHPSVMGALDYQVAQFDQGNETIPFMWKEQDA